jgi:hypothetical protein
LGDVRLLLISSLVVLALGLMYFTITVVGCPLRTFYVHPNVPLCPPYVVRAQITGGLIGARAHKQRMEEKRMQKEDEARVEREAKGIYDDEVVKFGFTYKGKNVGDDHNPWAASRLNAM